MEELKIYMLIYNQKFSENFPCFYFKNMNPENIIEIIKNCVIKEKNIFELGYVKLEDGIEY
jgi:hypothetical protein